MKQLPLRNFMLWLTILTLLWSSQGSGYIWCMTAEGTHLESIAENHCTTVVPGARSKVATLGAAEEGSSPCFDHATTSDTLQQRNRFDNDLGTLFLLATIAAPSPLLSSIVRHLDNNLILESPPRIATTLLVHRTIVLLI